MFEVSGAFWGRPFALSSVTVPYERVGPYELLYPLGKGGMAETFVALRRGPAAFEQRVCLKRILPTRTHDRVFVELFLDEARLLAQLRNAGIVQVLDFGEADGSYYLALELVDGMDLEALLDALHRKKTRLPPALAVHIAGQVLAALHYAHRLEVDGEPLNLVHRDISPSNILLSIHGEVKLTDFGIAKARGRKHKTQTGHTKGKVAYMSPEQVRGDDLDARSDLFAMGVVLYEMLTTVHPFDAATDLTLLNNILEGKRAPLGELAPDLPIPLMRFVERLLATDRNARPASAQAALPLIPVLAQPFLVQEKLAALVAAHRRVDPRSLGPDDPARQQPAEHDGATSLLPAPRSPSSDAAAKLAAQAAKTTRDMPGTPLRQRPSGVAWRGLLVLLVVAVAVGLWWQGRSDSSGQPISRPESQPAAGPAPARDPAPPPAELPAVPSAAAPPSEAKAAEEPAPPSSAEPIILHSPGREPVAEEGRREPKRKPSARRNEGTPASAEPRAERPERERSERTERTDKPASGAATKNRSGTAVSVDDF